MAASRALCAILVVAAATYTAAVCNTCHLRNNDGGDPNDNLDFRTKDYATRFDPATYAECHMYKDNACCSASVAAKVHDPGLMYGAEYVVDKCADVKGVQMSAGCYKFFVEEACFYECDVNAGKFRLHPECGRHDNGTNKGGEWGDPNAWQMANMPIKAQYCDDWYNACAEDFWCGSQSFFGQTIGQCNDSNCRKFKDVFANGKEVCENMWASYSSASGTDVPAFKYEADPNAPAYTMSFDPDLIVNGVRQGNPNNHVHAGCAFLDNCPGHTPPQTLEAACAESGQSCIPDADDCELTFLSAMGCASSTPLPTSDAAPAAAALAAAAAAAAAAAGLAM